MRAVFFIVLSLFLNAQVSQAGSSQLLKGGICSFESISSGDSSPGDEALWDCEHVGKKVTVKQIYEKRFRVVSVYAPFFNGQEVRRKEYRMIIEEQK